MSAKVSCPRCGRGLGWGLAQCSPRDHESCLGFLRDRAERERDEARRELAEAKAEVERLRAERDDYRIRLERIRSIASIEPRSAFDAMAEQAGPLPTAVLAQTMDARCRGGEVSEHDDDDDYDIGPVVALQHVTKRLRRKARAHERLARLRKSPALRQWWDWDRATYHEGAADALETMADRIERGEA